MINSQRQEGGDYSTNIQVEQVLLLGIDEKRAREIYHEMNLQLRNDYSQEALNIANARVAEFEKFLLPKMEQVDGALEAFADPSFQLLLIEAQKTAASTERPDDYNLLSELLIHRFQRGGNRIVRAAISLAVEIVDKISDEALLGLTAAHSLHTFQPVSGYIDEGLDVLNDLCGKILYGKLPTGQDWLDHLDILKAIRLKPFGRLKKVHQCYPESVSGYVDVGIDKKSANYDQAFEILKNNNLPCDLLVDHTLNNDFIRLCIPNRVGMNSIVTFKDDLVMDQVELSEKQINAIESIYGLYSQDGTLKQNNINLFMSEWDKRPNLKTLREWWDSITVTFTTTSVGKVLAHSNAQRCDNTLPPLD